MKHKIQKGFSLVTAIFLLVVLGGLGAMMVTFFAAQQQSSALDVLGSRAYHAARSGIEWGAYQVLRDSGGAFALGCQPGPTTQTIAAGTLAGTLSGFEVVVVCSSIPYSEDGVPLTVYQLTSTASQGAMGTPDRVERQISVTIAP